MLQESVTGSLCAAASGCRFGPVNVFWSARYDKAMVMFLHCLKEFAEFGHAADRAAGLPAEQCLCMPYK